MSRSRKKNQLDEDCPRGCRCDDCHEIEKTRVRKRLREIEGDSIADPVADLSDPV